MTVIDVICVILMVLCVIVMAAVAIIIGYVVRIMRNEKEYMERHLKEVEQYDTPHKH